MIGETIARRTESNSALVVSTLLHGAIAIGAVMVIGHDLVDKPAPRVELIDLAPSTQLVDPAPTQTSAPPATTKGSPHASQGRSGRRGHTVSRDDIPNPDPYATLTASVDHGPAIGTGTGDHGIGTGKGLYGNGRDAMPSGVGDDAQYMGVPSLRRDPAPRDDYSSATMAVNAELAGRTVVADLVLDRDGNVTTVTMTKGSGDGAVDARIAETIHHFKFYPALDDAGKPATSTYHWLWVLQPPFCADDFSTVSTGDKRPCVRAR